MTTHDSNPRHLETRQLASKKRWAGISTTIALILAGGLTTAIPAQAVSGPEVPANSNQAVVKVDTGFGTCTGTLIDRLWVATAASCFSANPAEFATLTMGKPLRPAKVLFGADASTHDKPGIAILQIHPVPAESTRDIVLVELALPIDSIPPLKIATTAPEFSEVLSFVGYGRTATEWVPDKPHTGDFRITSLSEPAVNVDPVSPGAALCAGDAGAPGIRNTPSGPELVAINSKSMQGGCLYSQATEANAIASDIVGLAGWISETTSEESASASSHLIKTNDVVAANASKLLFRYPGSGKTGLNIPEVVGSGWSGLKNSFIADWNGDGIQDIVAQSTDGRLDVYPGSTQGYVRPISLGTTWQDWTLTVGRWKKADKLPGIVGYNKSGDLFYLANATGTTLAPGVSVGKAWAGMNITMIDFDKDGNLDLLGYYAAGDLKLYRSNGAGAFISETRPVVGIGWNAINDMNPVYGFAGVNTVGVIARVGTGALRYYPLSAPRTWGTPVQIGSSGWNTRTIFGQTPK